MAKLQSLDLMQPCYLEEISFVWLNYKQDGYPNSNWLGGPGLQNFFLMAMNPSMSYGK